MDKLYKYQPISKYSLENFITNSLYAPLPNELNDPFDCFTHIYDAAGALVNDYHIISLTSNKRNLLMWSHYADSHKGMCLEFLLENECFTFENESFNTGMYYNEETGLYYWPITEVVYSADDIISNPNPEQADPFSEYDYLYHKGSAWSYEKEYRVIIKKDYIRQKTLRYSRKHLSSIYFGLNIDEREKKIIIDEMKKDKYTENANLYQMKRYEGQYRLTWNEIEI